MLRFYTFERKMATVGHHQKLYEGKSLSHAKNKKTPPQGGAGIPLTLRIGFGIGG
jgi:hypothetical protein